jgi:hypothetical protein
VQQMDQMCFRTRAFQALILAQRLWLLATSLGGFFVTCAALRLTLAAFPCNGDLEFLVAFASPPPGSRCPWRINHHSGD